MALLIWDTFTEAADTALSAHTPDVDTAGGGWSSSGVDVVAADNAVRLSGGNQGGWIDSGANDMSVSFSFNAGGADNRFTISARGITDRSFLGVPSSSFVVNVRPSLGVAYVYARVVGSQTGLGGVISVPTNTTDDFNVRLDVIGISPATINVYLDPGTARATTLVATRTSSLLAAGSYAGLYHNLYASGAARFDNFEVHDFTGGGSVQLVVQDSTHSHSAGNLTLSQQNTLAVNGATHGHSANNVTLSAGIDIVTQDATHAHLATNVNLTQQNSLVVQDSIHPHSAGNLTLTISGELTIQGASHTHAADNLTLTQAHVLTIHDAKHVHLATNVNLTQANQLAISSAFQSHTAGNLTLDSATQLAIEGGAHVHSADNLTLDQANILAIQDALHALSSDNIDLTQAHALIINGALHAHIADNIALTIPTGAVTPRRRTYIIQHDNRTYVVMS